MKTNPSFTRRLATVIKKQILLASLVPINRHRVKFHSTITFSSSTLKERIHSASSYLLRSVQLNHSDRRLVFWIIPSLVLALNCQANLVTVNFTGQVILKGGPMSSYFTVGEMITGSYTFDTSVPDEDPDPHWGRYGEQALVDVTVSFPSSGLWFEHRGGPGIVDAVTVGYNLDPTIYCTDQVSLFGWSRVGGSLIGGVPVTAMEVDFEECGTTAHMLTSDALPLLPLISNDASILLDIDGQWTQIGFATVTTRITGHVYCSCTSNSIAGALVQIGSFSATTDSSGSYSITNISPGDYVAIVSKTKYYTLTNSISISSSSATVTQDFSLTPMPGIDYFGVGVNWKNVNDANLNNVRGDIDATNLYSHLETDLGSIFKSGSIVYLDATGTVAGNLNIISSRFRQFTNSVCPNDTVVFYVSSHGTINYGAQIDVSTNLADGITASYSAALLNSLPATARKIVFLDACHSGAVAYGLDDNVPNIAILAASLGYIGTTETFSEPDGTGVFTQALIGELDAGVFDLNQICSDINNDHLRIYPQLIGQSLALRDSGYAVFLGLEPQLYERADFTGNLASNTNAVVQVPLKFLQMRVANGSFQSTLTNVPNSGSVAVETSTNLISWLQVAFNPASGTNLSYSFPATNTSDQFYRAKAVP